jgi:hypothetical protein
VPAVAGAGVHVSNERLARFAVARDTASGGKARARTGRDRTTPSYVVEDVELGRMNDRVPEFDCGRGEAELTPAVSGGALAAG